MKEKKDNRSNLFQAIKMVLSAFIGIRKHAADSSVVITPFQVIVTGVIVAALFVCAVITVVHFALH